MAGRLSTMDRPLTVGLALLIVVAGCGRERTEPSATDKALDELQAKYDELAGDKLDDPVQWASEDLENIGDWEYRVVDLSDGKTGADLEAVLNELGDERWELVWVEETSTGKRAILKRPAVSWLSKIPLSRLGRMMIGESDGDQ